VFTVFRKAISINLLTINTESHIANTAIMPGDAAQTLAQKKTDNYAELSNTQSCLLSLCRGNSWCVA